MLASILQSGQTSSIYACKAPQGGAGVGITSLRSVRIRLASAALNARRLLEPFNVDFDLQSIDTCARIYRVATLVTFATDLVGVFCASIV